MILATHGIVGSSIVQFTGLLDDYSGAAAAYSLRLLSSTYTGDAIRVRRASDNTEQDIGFVNNELDTTSLTTFCSGTNGFVKTWYDQSGNANNATQATAANQPQIVSSGSVILVNSKPSVKFDALDTLNISSISVNSFFMVNKLNVIGSVNYAMWDQVGIKGFFLGGTVSGVDGLGLFDGAVKSSSIGENTNQNLIYFNHNSSNYDIGLNSSSLVSLSSGTTINVNTIGRNLSGFSINGNNQEIIIYPSNQSSNRTGIETNINDFYSIY